MRHPRTTIPIEGHDLVVQFTDDQSRTLVKPKTNVAYHSASGAAAETRHVYLANSGVADRIASGIATSVLEVGLGTGLGLMLTLDAALAGGVRLDYTAVENEWLGIDVLSQLEMGMQINDASIATQFLLWRESLGEQVPPGVHHWQPGPDQRVAVCHQDAILWAADARQTYDAIYFDPFAPDVNSELWQTEFLARMYSLLSTDGRLVTYCVRRKVRDDFTSVGFRVERVRGPEGGKREVMVATKTLRR
jgi:tRNA U34 5-methylaminomethyl-2-thiouridine-forming methyltransferase MnmC